MRPPAAVGGNFAKWMFWAIVFITLPWAIPAGFLYLASPATLPAGWIGTGWMANLQSDLANFVGNFVVAELATSLAAFFVLRAILDTIPRRLPSMLLSSPRVQEHRGDDRWQWMTALDVFMIALEEGG